MQRNHFIIFILALSIGNAAIAQASKDTKQVHTLVVFFDGLRPDYITEATMPNLYAFSKRACYGMQHHSVYPTVTRVNSASLSTGSYPATHGLMNNSVYFPEIDKTHALNTAESADLDRITAATKGHLLTTVTLGELLKSAGYGMMVFSSGTSGQALLQNHTVSGGAVVNTTLILPASLRPTLEKEIGPVPPIAKPNAAQHKWITDALIKYGLVSTGPLVSTIWFSDPDATEHEDGVGVPSTMAAIRSVDEQFGRILAHLKQTGLDKDFNIIVSADHGFISHNGQTFDNVQELLIKAGIKKSKESDDVSFIGGGIYVKDHDTSLIRRVVGVLQSREGTGGIFTRSASPGSEFGFVAGTVSLTTLHLDHPDRAADIIVSGQWDDSKDKMGYPGNAFSRGVAGHGGFSSYEVHIALLAAGPS
ncbi:MAG TPA: alkaline phosphatase family protein, partial [Chitinophagaceae bacterium]|nr:alkaline phosphatase family protein [Chitinophagaceae bacterium]